ncbi:hypothetical protein IG631_22887 [Alternaria alternata]|nr:hypothetical protein IG631_22887 [Alternaria alternata]
MGANVPRLPCRSYATLARPRSKILPRYPFPTSPMSAPFLTDRWLVSARRPMSAIPSTKAAIFQNPSTTILHTARCRLSKLSSTKRLV